MVHTLTRSILLAILFVYGSFFCKTALDRSLEVEYKKSFFASEPSRILTRTILLNKKIAVGQFYQFMMISQYCAFNIPEDYCSSCQGGGHHEHDPVEEKIKRIIKKYMLFHLGSFFNIDSFYKLMELTLKNDPKNVFAREFGVHLSRNAEMMKAAVEVLIRIYNLHPDWDYAYNIGWLKFYCLRDYDDARVWFKKVQTFPNAPRRAGSLYQATFALEKKYDQAIISTELQLNQTTDEVLKNTLSARLDWFKSLSLLSKKSVEYKTRFGEYPVDLNDLVSSGLISSIPRDNIGSGFYWNSKLSEPSSKNNPFEIISENNPIDIENLEIDEEDDDK